MFLQIKKYEPHMKEMKKAKSTLAKNIPASRIPGPAVGKVHKPPSCPRLL